MEATGIRAVQGEILRLGHTSVAERIGELAERMERSQPRVQVAFCGLFSAGKSTLINALCETESLATGAVPTTAVITEVELPGAQGRVALLDTPGVDSTEDAHRTETMNALHKADLVALVVDYQHVESDANLELARSFSDQRKRLLFIVNQVDKHLDWELPFEDFQSRVEQTLYDWGIVCEQVYYTAASPCPYNQLENLRETLRGLADSVDQIFYSSVPNRLRELLDEHAAACVADRESAVMDALEEMLGYRVDSSDEPDRRAEIQAELARLESMWKEPVESLTKVQTALREAWLRSVDLAQITTYDSTELGKAYIESLRDGFRVGWIRADKKTEQARSERLLAFCSDLRERAEKFLLWPLKNTLRQFIQETNWASPAWMADVDAISADVNPELCVSLVKRGSLVSEHYGHQYVKDVANAVLRQVHVQVSACCDRWFAEAEQALRLQLERVFDDIRRYKAELSLWDELRTLRAEREAIVERLLAMCDDLDEAAVGKGVSMS